MFIDKKDLPVIAQQFFIEQDLKIKGKNEKSNIKFATIGEFIWQDESLSKNDIRVLLFINNCCRDKGFTWIGQEAIANEVQISRKQVNRIIRNLEEKNYIRTKMLKQDNNTYNNIMVVTYSPYLKEQYKTSLDKSKPARKCPAGRAENVPQAGPKRLQEEESLEGKNSSITDTTILFKTDTESNASARYRETDGLEESKVEFINAFKNWYPEVAIRNADINELKNVEVSKFTRSHLVFWRWYVSNTDDSYIKKAGSLDLLLLLRNQNKFKKFFLDYERHDDTFKKVVRTYYWDEDELETANNLYASIGVGWDVLEYKDDLTYVLPYSLLTGAYDENFTKYDEILFSNEISDEIKQYFESSYINPKKYWERFLLYSSIGQFQRRFDRDEISKIVENIHTLKINDALEWIKNYINEEEVVV